MQFLLDNDVSTRLARLLNESGHNAVTARDLGISHFHDHEHLLVAHQTNRVLISHNARDFIMLEAAWREWSTQWGTSSYHPGIILLPQNQSLRTYASEIDKIFASPFEPASTIVRFNPTSGWSFCPLASNLD